jgi:hypothetical protein
VTGPDLSDEDSPEDTVHDEPAASMTRPFPFNIRVEWRQVKVRADRVSPARSDTRDLYQVWKPGFPTLAAYGTSLNDAIVTLINRYGP